MTTKFAVLGSPIAHSLSPTLHRAAYKALELDFEYQALEVKSGQLSNILVSEMLSGASVTMPLKIEAFSLASNHDEASIITGVSNTLISSETGWSAFNTDVFGIQRSLGNSDLESVTILGSGATAKSFVYALAQHAPAIELNVLARNQDSKRELIEFATKCGMTCNPDDEEIAVFQSSLVVSTVPSGTMTDFWDGIGKNSKAPIGTLFDVAYNPWPSVASRNWRGPVISGIEMLKWQAAKQVEIFARNFADREIEPQMAYQAMPNTFD